MVEAFFSEPESFLYGKLKSHKTESHNFLQRAGIKLGGD